MEIFKRLFKRLNKGGVEYLVCGGIAMNLYGIERATADIDIAIRLEEDNISRFIAAAKKLGLKPKIPVKLEDMTDSKKREEWILEKGMIVFSLYDEKSPFFLLDVLIQNKFDFQNAFQKRKEIWLGDIPIPLVPLDILIAMKEETDRPQDRADVYYLKKIKEEWIDE